MFGPDILVRTLSIPTRTDSHGNRWQYHSRSDHHSKVACWCITFDLVRTSALLQRHIADDKVAFGINHEMVDFVHDRKKDLDLVLCTPAANEAQKIETTLLDLAEQYQIQLSDSEMAELERLPSLKRAPVGSVLVALEAKACMTAHQRALPRLYDELNSSQATVHGANDQAIAGGFTMVNIAETYLSPDQNKQFFAIAPVWSTHKQPRDASLAVDKIKQLPKRTKTGDVGYDALSIVVVNCQNDGSPITLWKGAPSPTRSESYDYALMIHRIANLYATRFKEI